MPPLLPTRALALLLALPGFAQEAQRPELFKNLNGTYAIELPTGYRQLSPNEALTLSERPGTPVALRWTAPRQQYALGPVEQWLAGKIMSPWIFVREEGSEWHVDGEFAPQLIERWREKGRLSDTEHEVSMVREAKVGPRNHEVHRALRTSTEKGGRAVTSLDIYASTGGRQVTLTFCAWADEFERWAPQFEEWLATLTFAREPRGQQELSDRLWTPLLTGGLVGLVLLVLYKHTKRSR